ncbi:MAG: DUF3791 domain-containing protein [Muribaculaceae bacterium]|nr:DUF3791 domain-containing protein [Muribaculaceae bacterium]
MLEEYRKLTDDEIKMGFVASCIEYVAEKLGVTYKEVFDRMKSIELIDKYIYPSFEALHTESRENLTENLVSTMQFWERK